MNTDKITDQEICSSKATNNQNNNNGLNLKEWNSMEHLLNKIPLKAQKGLTTFDLEITCVAAVDDYLALGTNVGLIYWYRRSTDVLERLKIEQYTSQITNVRVISSIDYIVAAGTRLGIICIFQIPKIQLDANVSPSPSPTTIGNDNNDHNQPTFEINDAMRTSQLLPQSPHPTMSTGDSSTKKKVQIFTVRDMHKSKITALEWSTNGMKLFSGDSNGLVIYTEMDYCSGVCKSIQLLNENCEIVQLSYAHKSLLISSIYQTLLYKTDVNSCQKVGTQDRKISGNFGAVFESGIWNRNLKLYVVRPGLRIWIADFEGSIKNTIVLKDWYYINTSNSNNTGTNNSDESNDNSLSSVQILPDQQQQQEMPAQQPPQPLQFGLIYNYLGKYLLTFTSTDIFVIDPINIQIVTSFSLNIDSVGINGNEIFILENTRQLIRLSIEPDPYSTTTLIDYNNTNTTNSQQQWPDTFNFLSTKLKKTTAALQKSTFLSTVKNVILETNDYLLQDSSRIIPLSSLSIVPPTTNFYDIPSATDEQQFRTTNTRNHFNHQKSSPSQQTSEDLPATMAQPNEEYQEKLRAAIEKFDKISQESFDKEIVVAQFKPAAAEGNSKKKQHKSNSKKQHQKSNLAKDGNLSSSPSGTTTPNTLMSDSVSLYSTSTNNSESNNNNNNNGVNGVLIINNNNGGPCTSESVSVSAGHSHSSSNCSPTIGPAIIIDHEITNDDSGNSDGKPTQNSNKLASDEDSTNSDSTTEVKEQTTTLSAQLQLQQQQQQYLKFGTLASLNDIKQLEKTSSSSDLESKEIMLAKLLNWSELLPDNLRLETEAATEEEQHELERQPSSAATTSSNNNYAYANLIGFNNQVRPCEEEEEELATAKTDQSITSKNGTTGGTFDLSTIATSTTTNCSSSSESTVKEDSHSSHSVSHTNTNASNNNSLDDSSLDIYTKYGNYNYHHHLSSITSNMSFGPPSGSSNIMNNRGSATNYSYIDEGDDDRNSGNNSYSSSNTDEAIGIYVNNVIDLQLNQLMSSSASCVGGGVQGIGGTTSSSGTIGVGGGHHSHRSGCSNSLLLSQDMNVDGIIGNDEWIYYKLPSTISSLITSDLYVVCIDTKQRVYYSSTLESHNNLRWIKTDYLANQLAISGNGQVVWRLLNNTLYSLTFPSKDGPFTIEGEWIEIGTHIKSISVDNEVGWMVKTNGTVNICQRIKDGKPIPNKIFECIPCPHSIDQITILGTNVWILTDNGKLFYRNKISVINLQGSEWIQFKFTMPITRLTNCSQPTITIITICLGPCDALWIMDNQYNLYFINGITYNSPGGKNDSVWVVNVANCCMNKETAAMDSIKPTFTTATSASAAGESSSSATTTPTPNTSNWKSRFVETLKSPILSKLLPSKQLPILTAKSSSVWFSQQGTTECYANKSIVTGHRWESVQLIPSTKTWKWSLVYANAIYKEHGLLWLLDTKKKLYHLDQKGKLHGLELPITLIDGSEVGSIVCVAPAPEALWVLTTKGTIYGRCNMNLDNDIGDHWDEIPLSPLENVNLVHVSCGSDVAWACDNDGQIYIRIGSLIPPQSTTDMCPPWIKVDGGPISSQGSKFTKVYVGANGHMVWALDNQNNVYTRVAIFSDVPIGTEWVLVSGIEATALTISDGHVYALSPKGQIFCRYGLSNRNFIGDYWRRIPGHAKTLTVSVCNQVWVLDTNWNLMKHLEEVLDFPKPNSSCNDNDLLTPTATLVTSSPEIEGEDTGDWELLG